MHSEYASAWASGLCADKRAPPAGASVVVGCRPAAATVGDVGLPEQAVTVRAKATAAATLNCDRRIIAPGDTASRDNWSPAAPMTAAVETRTVDRVRLLVVLLCCRSHFQSRQCDVAGTYVVFDTPTILGTDQRIS
jgi:hypothetical protein